MNKPTETGADPIVIVGSRGPVEMTVHKRTQRVMIERRGQKLCAGFVVYNNAQGGWKFLPHFQAKPSRKFWPTPEDALRGRVKDYTLVPSSDTGAKS